MWLSLSNTQPAPDAQALMLWLITVMALLTASLVALVVVCLWRLLTPKQRSSKKMKTATCRYCQGTLLMNSPKKCSIGLNQQE